MVVFRYPVDPSLDYIKRVVGLPGDKVAYRNKRLTINGEADGDATQMAIILDKERLYLHAALSSKAWARSSMTS